MREIRKSGSVGALGGRPPGATRPRTDESAAMLRPSELAPPAYGFSDTEIL